jgi:BirA family biotin operon repressor/biotin-[acetyl-CoA-carboxylase] ligase
MRRDELPVPSATSLAVEGSLVTDREPVLRAILRELARRYTAFAEHDGDAVAAGLHDAYRSVCTTIGRPVRVTLPGDRLLEGEAVDVDGGGRLVVRAGADTHALAAGDVVHVR